MFIVIFDIHTLSKSLRQSLAHQRYKQSAAVSRADRSSSMISAHRRRSARTGKHVAHPDDGKLITVDYQTKLTEKIKVDEPDFTTGCFDFTSGGHCGDGQQEDDQRYYGRSVQYVEIASR
ncbi:hypothetical protein [Chryseolinea serpens]|uniref:hypothetical protein n=1 Tax=Chryseolinea serpens TaxID=947013 RepID=UPI0009350153|nr:hypothetical protein [Chryseolinea serpens]